MKNVSFARYFLLLVVIAIGLSIISRIIQLPLASASIEISQMLVAGAVVGGGLVAATVVIRKLVESGRCKWLLKDKN